MFFELIGTILAGLATGLAVWALNRALRGRLPGWLAPVAAGAAMLLAAISSEYGWYDRTTATMPDSFFVAQAIEERSLYRPWTYAFPFVSRFVAVDRSSLQTHPNQPGQRIVTLVFYGRWARTSQVPVLFDCTSARQADIADGISFDGDGAVLDAQWYDVPADDPVLAAACATA